MLVLFSQFDVVVECVMFLIAFFMLFLIWGSNPVVSTQLRLLSAGFGFSLLAILFHIGSLHTIANVATFSHARYVTLYCLFGLCYIIILGILFVYVDLLSYDRRANTKPMLIMAGFFSVVYAILIYTPVITNNLYYVTSSGKIKLTFFEMNYCIAGMICSILVILVNVANKGKIPRIVTIGASFVIPFVMIILSIQYFYYTLIVTSVTYVMPFVICFLLFHANTYNEVSGFQRAASMPTVVGRYISRGHKYVVFCVKFPRLQQREYSEIEEVLKYCSSKVCRKMERLSPGMHLYEKNTYTYLGACRVLSDESADRLTSQILSMLTEGLDYKGEKFQAAVKLVVARETPKLTDAYKLISVMGSVLRNMGDDENSEVRVLVDADYDSFYRRQKLQHSIISISRECNLEDERIVPFVQPIRNMKTGTFRTAEALMRLKIDDQIVYPDVFIPLAEENGAIHAMTLIMINKICMHIRELAKEYDFDAISINCSTRELESVDFYREVLEIIQRNNVDPAMVRLEITESTDAKNYNRIYNNMVKLVGEGVKFYLDDFGTGYSNIERIASFPFSTIKFDKSTLYKATEDIKSEELFTLLADYFRNNKLNILVEGVEDESQRDFALDKGFEYIQGYFYSKPVPISELTGFFEKKTN